MSTETTENVKRFVSRGSILVSIITSIIVVIADVQDAQTVQQINVCIAVLIQLIQYYYDNIVIQFERLKFLFLTRLVGLSDDDAIKAEKIFNDRMTTFIYKTVKKAEEIAKKTATTADPPVDTIITKIAPNPDE